MMEDQRCKGGERHPLSATRYRQDAQPSFLDEITSFLPTHSDCLNICDSSWSSHYAGIESSKDVIDARLGMISLFWSLLVERPTSQMESYPLVPETLTKNLPPKQSASAKARSPFSPSHPSSSIPQSPSLLSRTHSSKQPCPSCPTPQAIT